MDAEDCLKIIVNSGENVLFFLYKEIPFAATEQNRITFAKLKDKNDEDHEFKKMAYFEGLNLIEAAKGKKVIKPFDYKDVKYMNVISQKDIIDYTLSKIS